MPYATGDRVLATLGWAGSKDLKNFAAVKRPGVVVDVDTTSEPPFPLYYVRLDEPLFLREGQPLIQSFVEIHLEPEQAS